MLNPGTLLTITQLVLSGLFIGVLIAAPTGPVNIVCIQRTLERGFWGGFTAGVGAVLADGLLAGFAAFGITAISAAITAHQQEMQLIGGIVMIAFGVKLFTVEPKLAKRQNGTSLAELRRIVDWVPEPLRPALRFQIWRMIPHAGVIPQTFFLTILNPGAILGMLAFFGGLGSLQGGPANYLQALILVLAVMSGGLIWWAVLSRFIERLRDRVNERRLKRINQATAVVLLTLGGVLFFQFAMVMLGDAMNTAVPPVVPPASTLGNPLLSYPV